MIEQYLQITCDNCGDVNPSDTPNITAAKFRFEMKKYGWRNYGKLDYCRKCVKLVISEKRSLFTQDYEI